MNPCPDSIQIAAYHDGELSHQARQALARHLAACPACRKELAALEAQSRWLQQAPVPGMAAALAHLAEPWPWRQPRALLRTAWAVTALAALLLLGVLLWIGETSTGRSGIASAPAGWEMLALNGDADAVRYTGTDAQLARWMAQDLARNEAQ